MCSDIEKQIEKERSEVLGGVQTILQNIKTDQSNNDVVQKLIEQVDILNREQTRLASDSDNYRQKNLKLLKEYARLESENFILEQKIKREKEKRKEMDTQKLQDEFDLEISSEREFNQNIKSRSHSLPPSSQPPEVVSQLPGHHHQTSPLRASGLTPRGNSVSNIEPYVSPRRASFSPAKPPVSLPIPVVDNNAGLSSSLPNQNNLLSSSFAERLNQTDPYQARMSTSPRLGTSPLQFVKQSPRKH